MNERPTTTGMTMTARVSVPRVRGPVMDRARAAETPTSFVELMTEATRTIAAALVTAGPLQHAETIAAARSFVAAQLGVEASSAEQLSDDRSDPRLGDRLHAALVDMAKRQEQELLSRLLREARRIADVGGAATRGQQMVLEDIAAALVS